MRPGSAGRRKGITSRMRLGRVATLALFAVERSVERSNGRPRGLQIQLVPDDTGSSLVGFVQEVAEPGSTVNTDGWAAYLLLTEASFVHRRVVERSGKVFANPVPNVDQAIGNLKAWLIGTHKGVTRRHLAAYLDEFVLRYNRHHNLAAAF